MQVRTIGVAGIVFVGTGFDSSGRALPVNALDHADDDVTNQFKAGLSEFARGGTSQWTDNAKKLWRESLRIYLVTADDRDQLYHYANAIRQAYSQTAVSVLSGNRLVEITE